jgi:hypothetical protein
MGKQDVIWPAAGVSLTDLSVLFDAMGPCHRGSM